MSDLSKVTAFLGFLLPALIASCGTGGAPFQQLEGNEITIRKGAHPFKGDRPLVRVRSDGRVRNAIADTGCTTTLLVIDESAFAEKARSMPIEKIGSVDGALEGIKTRVKINGVTVGALAVSSRQVVWSKDYQVLIGVDVLRRFRVCFDFEKNQTLWRKPKPQLTPNNNLLKISDSRNSTLFIIDTGATSSTYLKSGRPVATPASYVNSGVTLQTEPLSPHDLSKIVNGEKTNVILVGISQLRLFISELSLSGN